MKCVLASLCVTEGESWREEAEGQRKRGDKGERRREQVGGGRERETRRRGSDREGEDERTYCPQDPSLLVLSQLAVPLPHSEDLRRVFG